VRAYVGRLAFAVSAQRDELAARVTALLQFVGVDLPLTG
jgi:hypothetical protein